MLDEQQSLATLTEPVPTCPHTQKVRDTSKMSDSVVNDFPNELDIPFISIICDIQLSEAKDLPDYLGSTLHGGFGHALMAVSNSLYNKVFAPFDAQGKASIKPFLFAIQNNANDHKTSSSHVIRFSLTLFGNAVDTLPEVLAALMLWQTIGLGAKRNQFKIKRIATNDALPQMIFCDGQQYALPHISSIKQVLSQKLLVAQTRVDANATLIISTTSPWHLKHKRQVLRQAPSAELLALSTWRRLHKLNSMFDKPVQGVHSLPSFDNVQLSNESTYHNYVSRYSKKDKQRHFMDSLQGIWAYSGNTVQFLPVLALAQIIGVGNKTTFGFGQFEFYLGR